MAPASRVVAVVALSLLYLSGEIVSTEYFSTLTFFNNELHKQGCSSLSEWEDYAADCGKSLSFFTVALPRPARLYCHCSTRYVSLAANKLTTTNRDSPEELTLIVCSDS